MAVLIPDMEMPKSCGKCPFALTIYDSETEGKCILLGYGVAYLGIRNHACPLVALPEHGRLIEENKAYDSIAEEATDHCIDMDAVGKGLECTPTVLEASK